MDIEGNANTMPATAAVTFSGNVDTYLWAASSTDPRALQKNASTTDRIAATWYDSTFTFNLNITDGLTHQLALYVLDLDGQGRNESITISNASTHAALASHSIKVNGVGDYLVFDVSGNVNVTIAQPRRTRPRPQRHLPGSSDAHSNPNADSNSDSNPDAYSNTNTHADTYAHADTNTHADAGSDANTHTDSDADADSHSTPVAPSGYTLTSVSMSSLSSIAARVSTRGQHSPYAVRNLVSGGSTGAITRYDYTVDPATGRATLSNPVDLVTGVADPLGLAFDGNTLYFSVNPFNSAGNTSESSGAIACIKLDSTGGNPGPVQYLVTGIDNGDQPGVDQIQVANHILYVGIGIQGQQRTDANNLYHGDYDRNYNGTIGSIDLSKATVSPTGTPIDETVYATPADDGLFHLYASGFRNPFGIRVDARGELWVSDNGGRAASYGTLTEPQTDDLLYANVKQGDVGIFPTSVSSAGLPGAARRSFR